MLLPQVALHAEQVRQALPGGLDIVGVYLFGSGKVGYCTTQLRVLVHAILYKCVCAHACVSADCPDT